MNKILQFVLWNTCKNNCDFCFDKYCLKNDNKLDNLRKVIELIEIEDVNHFDGISLIGGEIFDTGLTFEESKLFYNLIDRIFLLKKRLFFMTNLIYDKSILLQPCIDHIIKTGNITNTCFCTSYDLTGRFHNKISLDFFDKNFDYIKSVANLHIEMILSYSLLDAVNNNKFSFKDFFEKYTYSVGFNAPYPGLDNMKTQETFYTPFNFFPKREMFFKFLKKCFIEEKILDINSFMNRDYYSDVAYFIIDGKYKKIVNRTKYGNMAQDFHNYIDDDNHTMYEDFMLFKELYGL